MAPGHTVAVAAGSIDEGQVAVTLRSRGTPATWIVRGEHWWPPPRVGHPWDANVRWRVDTCGRCKHERVSLVATRPIGQGSELCAQTGYPGQVYLPDEAALHLAMDGSAKGRTAGAGAVLWGRGELGRWQRIAEATISIGSKTSPTCAEAWGLSAAAHLLLAYDGSERRVHISGDCPMLVRFCAEQGRMREFLAQSVAERALARLAGAGWSCAWTIVPGKHNCAADSIAKPGPSLGATRFLTPASGARAFRGSRMDPSRPWLNLSSLLASLRAAVAASGTAVRRALWARTVPSPLGEVGRRRWRTTFSAPTGRTGTHGCSGRCPTASMVSRCS